MENLPPNEVLNNLKKKSDEKSKWTKVNYARYTMHVIAALLLLSVVVLWSQNELESQGGDLVIYVMLIMAAVFIGLSVWTLKNPLLGLSFSIGFFLLILILSAIGDPSAIFSGLWWKITILGLFIRGLLSVKNISFTETNDDLLDDI